MSEQTQTIDVPHLGGSRIGYRLARPYDASLPTIVMANSFSTSAALYRPQFADDALAAAVNLLAIEPYGHGETRAGYADYTYWDSAIANLQVLDALGIGDAFALGTSQGGWIATRMALLAPERIKGIMPLGTSMDYESQRTRDVGCWDAIEFLSPAIDMLAAPVGDDWVIPEALVDSVLVEGFGVDVSDAEREFWRPVHAHNYSGDDGRQRLRTISVNLRDRDGLHGRVGGVRCPVLWMQGTADRVYSVANAQHEIALFTGSPNAELRIVDGGHHFLSATHPAEVNAAIIEFVGQHA